MPKEREQYDLSLYKEDKWVNDSLLFWKIAYDQNVFYDWASVKEFVFPQKGKYDIEVYEEMKLVASEEVTVDESPYLNIRSSRRITQGDTLNASIDTNMDGEVRWSVIEGGDVITSSTERQFLWKAEKHGYYELRAYLDLGDSTSLNDEVAVIVEKKKKAKTRTTRSPVNTPRPPQQPVYVPPVIDEPEDEEPPIDEDKGEAWFERFSGQGRVTLGPKPSRWEDAEFQQASFSIEFRPSVKSRLVGFEYFGNITKGRFRVSFECLTCEESVNNSRSVVRNVAWDQEKTIEEDLSFAVKYGFNPNHNYRIRLIPQDETELGFIQVNQKEFSHPEVGKLIVQGEKVSMFNLVFEVE